MPKISEKLGCSEKKVFDNLKDYGIKKDKRVWKKQCASNPKKVVLQFDLKGELVKQWISVKEPSDFYQNTNIWKYKDNI